MKFSWIGITMSNILFIIFVTASAFVNNIIEGSLWDMDDIRFSDQNVCEEDGQAYNVRDTWMPEGHCLEHSCLENGIVNERGCDEVSPTPYLSDPRCYMTEEDLSQPFPDCCPKPKCPVDCTDGSLHFEVNVSWTPPGQCDRKTCIETNVINTTTCDEVSPTPYFSDARCYMTAEDLSQPFPDCCPKPKCPVDCTDGSEHFEVNVSWTPPGQCVRKTCIETNVINTTTCKHSFSSKFWNDPRCYKTEEDLSKPFPNCCPSLECPSGCEEGGRKFDESWTPQGQCARHICNGNKNISSITCDEYFPPFLPRDSNCNITEEDLSKPFPDCCRKPNCPSQVKKGCIESRQQYKIGESWTSSRHCARYTCVGKNEIHGNTCPIPQLSEGCFMMEEDLTKPFPDCCPRSYCPPPVCWVDGRKYEVGENLTLPGQCGMFTCTANNTVVGTICDYKPPPSFGYTERKPDLSLPFPACCAENIIMPELN